MRKLNDLQLFTATVNHEYTGEFLYYAHFSGELYMKVFEHLKLNPGEDIGQKFGMFSPERISAAEMKEVDRNLLMGYYEGIDLTEASIITNIGILHQPGSSHHFSRIISPLRNARGINDIIDYPAFEYDMPDVEEMKRRVDEIHAMGKVASCKLMHIYENAWQLRGYEEFLMDLMTEPEGCEILMDRFYARNMAVAKAAALAGVDLLRSADDVASQNDLMFAPEIWRTTIKPRWEKIFQEAKKIKPDIQIHYHSDGNILSIIPELIDIGVTILNPIQPECLDVEEVKKRFGKRLSFDGTIGTQSVMPFGTADEVRQTVRRMKEIAGYDGALILSPTHLLEPEVPAENVMAFIEENQY